jgi:hypothetical protein
MVREAARREEGYREDPLGPGDYVLRRHEKESKLHPRWDGPFVVRATTNKNVYQLQTRNGYVLRNLYNCQRLRRYFPSGDSASLWFANPGLKKKELKFREEENRKTQRQNVSVVPESR